MISTLLPQEFPPLLQEAEVLATTFKYCETNLSQQTKKLLIRSLLRTAVYDHCTELGLQKKKKITEFKLFLKL